MRNLASLIGVAGLALLLGAGQATAVSSIDLKYLGGASGAVSGDSVGAADGDILRFAITINLDSLGVKAWAFVLEWDSDGENELDLVGLRQHGLRNTTLSFDLPGPPPATVGFIVGYSGTHESTSVFASHVGYIYGYSEEFQGPHPANLSFRVGVVEFHVNSPNNNPGPDIRLGYFHPHGEFLAIVDGSSTMITPNFGSFQVDVVPEAGTAPYVGMSVLGLVWAGRWLRRRS